MSRKIPPGNPNPRRRMLAFHFLRALARISQGGAAQALPSRRRSAAQRGQRIKRAAYASIALAAGPRRAWSRAILCGIHGRARVRGLPSRKVTCRKKASGVQQEQREGGSQVDELRRLVPGGRGMNLCSLLEEAGSYIQCLTAQVQLMKEIADGASK